ncbi:MAG TPA: beta-ketoacyl-[acyl-carrier-protein] synthase family protein [Deltaproteobacteria bacterium]|nr:beta-ketoacyl-[acyl-carrier-protein] synthase family protein [Deltaproteobacteria bacterium]
MSARRVAVTGVGMVTAHGAGWRRNMEAFKAGRDSTAEVRAFDGSGYRASRCAEARDFVFAYKPLRLRASRLDRASKLLLTAFDEAMAMASMDRFDEPAAVVLGTTLGGMLSGERYHADGLRRGFDRARVSLLTDYLAHSQAANLKLEYSIRGPSLTLSDACASGATAIGTAFHMVRAGETRVAVAGGYDTMSEFTFAGFNALQAVSPTLCRPFDARRDGLVLGEGAAVLILEEMESAVARGAAVLGEVLGYGSASDAFHMTRPDPEGRGAASAMRRALDDAGLSPEEIDYINAHGTATPLNDLMEARAVRAVFGGRDVPVSSVKPMVGHTLGAAGAVEAAVCLMAISGGFLPPNINCDEPDPQCPLRIVHGPEEGVELRTALSNSFGFGGTNASLALAGVRR